MNTSQTITVGNLESSNFSLIDKMFLDRYAKENPIPADDHGTAVYFRDGDNFIFLKNALVPTKKSRSFCKEAPHGFYLGGSNGFIRTKNDLLVVSDERLVFFKPFPSGRAHHDEGRNLMDTFLREFAEEVSVFALDRSAYYVPTGSKAKFKGGEIGIMLKSEEPVEVGKLNTLGYFVNEPEKLLELHVEWDISDLSVPYSVLYTEDWFQGGWSGIPVYALSLKTGKIVGLFAGQQGFVPIDWVHHPSVANYLGPKRYL